jgi:acyl-homoserine lactone acylase PvdQ
MTTDPIEQLKRLVEAANTSAEGMTLEDGAKLQQHLHDAWLSTDLPALLAAWEADRAKIENAWHELRNLLDRNMPQDSLASAIAYMIDHSNTGWQRVCGWEKLGKAKDALLDEKDTRIAKLEAVVEAAKRERDGWRNEATNAGGQLLAVLERIEADGYTVRFNEQNCETMWNRVNSIAALSALEGGQQ